jgi:hypothetical protein
VSSQSLRHGKIQFILWSLVVMFRQSKVDVTKVEWDSSSEMSRIFLIVQ